MEDAAVYQPARGSALLGLTETPPAADPGSAEVPRIYHQAGGQAGREVGGPDQHEVSPSHTAHTDSLPRSVLQ